METTLKRTQIGISPVFKPKKKTGNALSYDIIQQRKRKQQRLVEAKIIEKPKMRIGFTVAERIAFENGTPVEEFFDKIAAKYEF